MALHILANRDSLQRCEHALHPEDALLLIEDGVYLALQNLPTTAAVFALADDLHRRGVTAPERIKGLDMAGFVELSTQHRHCLSW